MKRLLIAFLIILGNIFILSAQPQSGAGYKEILSYENFINGVYNYNQRSYSAAVDSFLKALEYESDNYRTRMWLGKAYYLAGYVKNAIAEWERVISHGGGTNLLRQYLNYIYFQRSLNKQHRIEASYIPLKEIKAVHNRRFEYVHPVCVTSRGEDELLVSGFSSGGISIFDHNGNPKAGITKGKKRIVKPFGVATDENGNIYLTDFGADTVYVYNSSKTLVASFGGFGLENGKFAGPEGIYVDKKKNIYIADSGNNRIQQFSINSNFDVVFTRSFGGRGSTEGKFFRPTSVAVSPEGKIYVSDTGNRRIQIFDDSGNYLSQFGSEFLKKPRGIKFFGSNNLYIADEELGIIKYNILEATWSIVSKRDNEEIFQPVDVHIDSHNLMYVADYGRKNMAVLIPEKLKYVNLNVEVLKTFNAKYPIVHHRVYVNDRLGKEIEGLDAANFKVYEFNKLIKHLSVRAFEAPLNRMKIVIINDRSVKMKKYNSELKELMDIFFKKLNSADKVKVINFSSGYSDMLPFMNQRLRPLEAITEGNFNESEDAGRALYQGIGRSFSDDYKSRILIITNGNLSENSFDPYGLEGLISYAKNNYIPVYILCFGSGERVDDLKLIAKKTGGRFIQASGSNDIYKLADIMRAKKDISYFLTYPTQSASDFAHKAWRTLRIEVDYKRLIGVSSGGYYIP
jgi:DNA-binding beta-propeller fold protein YncE